MIFVITRPRSPRTRLRIISSVVVVIATLLDLYPRDAEMRQRLTATDLHPILRVPTIGQRPGSLGGTRERREIDLFADPDSMYWASDGLAGEATERKFTSHSAERTRAELANGREALDCRRDARGNRGRFRGFLAHYLTPRFFGSVMMFLHRGHRVGFATRGIQQCSGYTRQVIVGSFTFLSSVDSCEC